jgi:hypothetical protein
MPMEKAKILNKSKASNEAIEVMFNPPSLKISTGNTYANLQYPGVSLEKQQYIKNNSDILSVELFFDTTREGDDVRTKVDPILDLTKVPKDAKEPPKLVFAWGSFTFDCVIISIDHTYDYFNASGQALRATLVVRFRHIESEDAAPVKAAAPTPAKPATKQKVLKAGEDLPGCCASPADWRSVAELNGIDNPLLVSTGQMVGQTINIP